MDYSGNRTPHVPRHTYHVGVQHRRPIHGDVWLFGRLELIGDGGKVWDDANSFEEGAHTTLNMRLGAEWEKWDIHFWAKNLLDEKYSDHGIVNPVLGNRAHLAAPRMIGTTLTTRF